VLPWLAAAVALWAIGRASDHLLRKTGRLRVARSYLIAGTQLIAALAVIPVALTHDLATAIACITLAAASMGANAVYFNTLLATGYAGPGTYASQSFPALIGKAAITIPPASAPQIDSFTSRDGGSTMLTVRADGSGVVNIIDWGSGGSDSRISGSVSWTCSASR